MGKQNNISIPIDLKKENLKIKLKKARLRISFKISRIIKENVEKCFHQSTRVDFYLMGLKNAVINDKKKFKYISMFLKKEIILRVIFLSFQSKLRLIFIIIFQLLMALDLMAIF